MGGRVQVIDHGLERLLGALEKADAHLELTVGLHAEEGGAPAKGSGLTMVEVAELNEFGSPEGLIPPRPAISGWADENEERAIGDTRKAFEKSIEDRALPIERLEQLAQKYAGEVQQKIADGVPPQNADSTIRKKGSSTPLIDTGTFRSSIAGRVRAAK